MTLKDFIEDWNRQHALLQKEVAEKAGISESRLSLYCNGLTPSDDHKAAIVAVLRECTGKKLTVQTFWPVTEPEQAA